MRRSAAARSSLAALAGLGLLLTACSPQAQSSPQSSRHAADGINIVASTNVYGDIAKTIGGDKVSVTALITKTSQDPHSYEATSQDRLAVSKADLVLENGGGYDGFIHMLAQDSGLDDAKVLNAVELSGLAHPEGETASAEATPTEPAAGNGSAHDHGELNEHVWYSLHAMEQVADGIAAKLSELDPASAPTFQSNASAFKASVEELHGKIDALKPASAGAQVAVTEPVPLYLLEDAGLVNATPEDYTAAIEEGSDVPPAVLKAVTDLVTTKSVRFLAYNSQTEGPQTESLKKAAEAAGVPVVDFHETLPEGKTYLQWMTDNVENISKVLETNS